jgi:hypothetical protein
MALTKNDREILDADALRESARLARADLQLKARAILRMLP